ncbi:MAG: thioredoxin domain-containing protein, partial [Pirellulaceae bacterium]|nr:thioredoxin domain-containing protein [Pirellulaceae bacterium]
LLRLAKLTDNADFAAKAERALVAVSGNLVAAPHAMFKTLCAVDFFIHPPKEIVLVGAATDEPVRTFLKTLHERFIPNKVVAAADPADATYADLAKRVPLLESKTRVNGQAAAYVCRNHTCEKPATTPEAFAALLQSED